MCGIGRRKYWSAVPHLGTLYAAKQAPVNGAPRLFSKKESRIIGLGDA